MRVTTPLARYQALLLCTAWPALIAGSSAAFGCLLVGDASAAAPTASAVVTGLLGAVRGWQVSVTVDGGQLVVRNPTRTVRVARDDVVEIVNGTPAAYVPGGWAPAVVVAGHRKPILLYGLLVPQWRFLDRRGWRLLATPTRDATFERAPDASYRSAARFKPLRELLAGSEVPVAPEWRGLLGDGTAAGETAEAPGTR